MLTDPYCLSPNSKEINRGSDSMQQRSPRSVFKNFTRRKPSGELLNDMLSSLFDGQASFVIGGVLV